MNNCVTIAFNIIFNFTFVEFVATGFFFCTHINHNISVMICGFPFAFHSNDALSIQNDDMKWLFSLTLINFFRNTNIPAMFTFSFYLIEMLSRINLACLLTFVFFLEYLMKLLLKIHLIFVGFCGRDNIQYNSVFEA